MTQEEVNSIVERYNNYLINEGINQADFEISDDLVKFVFFKYIYPSTKLMHIKRNRGYFKAIATQLNYTRLSLLRVKYYRNGNKAAGIKEGYVYIASNKAWPDKYKIGSTISVKDRLTVYQSYSPNRDYIFDTYYFSHDRRRDEHDFHKSLSADHEWIQIEYVNGRSSKKAVIDLFKLKREKDLKSLMDNLGTFG